MTHGPPLGHGDVCAPWNAPDTGDYHTGCADLLDFVEHAAPPLHVCGHQHNYERSFPVADGKLVSTNYTNVRGCGHLASKTVVIAAAIASLLDAVLSPLALRTSSGQDPFGWLCALSLCFR